MLTWYKKGQNLIGNLNKGFCSGFQVNKDKFFILNVEFKKDIEDNKEYNSLNGERQMYLKHYEDRKHVQQSGKKTCFDKNNEKTDYKRGFILFRHENETIAYDFLKQDPFYTNGYVDNWEIEEVEIFDRGMTKELSRVYTYLAR